MKQRNGILPQLARLGDPIRGRILLLLQGRELAVGELQTALQLPQSTVSRHLKVLAEGGWVTSRPDGTSQHYRFAPADLAPRRQQLWELVREDLAGLRSAGRDQDRLRAVLSRRHTRSREFFSSRAGQWDRLREELFGARYELSALLGLLEPDWVVGDLGCGTGQLSAAIAPFVRRVIAVDESPEMLAAAGQRLRDLDGVECREGELELLPLNEAELDLAILVMVLAYVPDPGRVIAEASRAVVPGGRVLVMDLQRHERTEYQAAMGHVWFGFGPGEIQEWLAGGGLRETRVTVLPPDPAARGPGLFIASGRKPA